MELSLLFTSSCKYRLLRALSNRDSPIHLRGLAELADVQLRSAQLAVGGLVKDGVIKKRRHGNRSELTLNSRSQYAGPLRQHFRAEQERGLTARAADYKDLTQILKQVDEIRLLSWRAGQSHE